MMVKMMLAASLGLGFVTNFVFGVESAVGGEDWISYLLNGGPFAVVVFLLVTDKLCTPSERNRLRIELTASHAREETLNRNIREDFVPLVTRAQDSISRSTEATEKIVHFLATDERYTGKKS